MNFHQGDWVKDINVRDFIIKNYTPYDGGPEFLAAPTARTRRLWELLSEKLKLERERRGVYDIDEKTISTITSHSPGYIDRSLEQIVGLQTDEPLKRAIMPFGGIRLVYGELEAYGKQMDPAVTNVFRYRKTHNDGVFDAYTEEMRMARHTGIITGLPDAYGRGRIIGDYRRVALYGVDRLIAAKKQALRTLVFDIMDSPAIRLREEISEQIRALGELKEMAASYGFDLSRPATDVKEAIQWLYFGYLAAVKEQNGAAMSLGRTSTFLDIYFERDIEAGLMTESEAQEIMDDFVLHLRMARHLRTPEYNELFGGDPTWVTESIGGMGVDGRTMVTKNSYRMLHTLINLGTAPEPNLTVLWSRDLPDNFKKFCSRMSIETDSIQYENDDIMRPLYGDDYGISCCVSAMEIGKQMQFFGARANLAKSLLYAINGGVDEIKGEQVIPGIEPLTGDVLNYSDVITNYKKVMDYVAELYVDAINIIHYMHDKYAYEASQMALHDTAVERLTAFGIAGLSVAADSLSAVKFATVRPIRDERGIAVDFETIGDFPKYGNDNDLVVGMPKGGTQSPRVAYRKHFSATRNTANDISSVPCRTGSAQDVGHVDTIFDGSGKSRALQSLGF